MTWNTSCGVRVLQGAEAVLFAEALEFMVSYMFDEYNPSLTGGDIGRMMGRFVGLSPLQQLTVLEQVAVGLLTETAVAAELNEYNECAIFYVYRWYDMMTTSSFEDYDPAADDEEEAYCMSLTKHIAYAYNEVFADEADEADETDDDDGISLYPLDRSNVEACSDALTRLEDRILWDNDFCLHGSLIDRPDLRAQLYIDQDYFEEQVRVAAGDSVETLKTRIFELCSRVIGER